MHDSTAPERDSAPGAASPAAKVVATFPDDIAGLFILCEPVGSRRCCVPAPADTDDDYLLLVADIAAFDAALVARGFVCGGSNPQNSRDGGGRLFCAYRKGDINLTVTWRGDFFERFMVAHSLATRLNLLDKADRIALFQGVLYANRALAKAAP